MRIAILAILFLTACSSPSIQKTMSPKGTYRAEIVTNSKVPEPQTAASLVKLTAYKNGQEYLKEIVLDENEYSDTEWNNAHPDNIWVTDSILRLGWKKDFSDTDPDWIYIHNETGKPIRYLKVNARDIFMLFDVPAKSCLKLKSGHQRWLAWLTADGQFDGGEKLNGHGVNFYHQDKINKPLRYCIRISEADVKIESSDLDGFYGDKLVVPRQNSCPCQDDAVNK